MCNKLKISTYNYLRPFLIVKFNYDRNRLFTIVNDRFWNYFYLKYGLKNDIWKKISSNPRSEQSGVSDTQFWQDFWKKQKRKAHRFWRAFLWSGVGGVRTLVQTTNIPAFYMLISWLVFDCETDKNTQTPNLVS